MLAPVTVPGHAAEAVSRQPGVVAVTQRGSETPLSLLAGGYLMSDITATTLWVSCGHISPARRRFGRAASAPDRRTLTARRSSRRLREWRLHSLDLSRGKVHKVPHVSCEKARYEMRGYGMYAQAWTSCTYMHGCMHACIHTYIHTYMHACINTYIHTCIRAYIHAYTHTHIHTHVCVPMIDSVEMRDPKMRQETSSVIGRFSVLATE